MRSSTLALLVFCASAGLANAQPQAVSLLDSLPTSFELNRGQADDDARFVARGAGYALLLRDSGAVLRLRGGTVTVMPVGGLEKPTLSGESLLPGTANYFVGSQPERWRTSIPTFARARYSQVYPGIDLVYYGHRGRLEYDFEVAPGARPDAIRMKFDGALGLSLDQDGDLAVGTTAGVLTVERPKVYQDIDGERRNVEAGFALGQDGIVGFTLGRYDEGHVLVIDPVLVYSTAIGQFQDHGASGIAVDGTGASYIAGFSSVSFNLAEYDAFIAKINPTGTALVFSAYFGGAGSDWANSVAIDASSNIFVTGLTDSVNFPTVGAAQGSQGGGGDAFVTKLSAAGDTVLYSTYLGGNSWEEGWDILIDQAGNASVVGMTQSLNFPVSLPNQATLAGGSDAFISRFDAFGSLVVSTYLGGSADDSAAKLVLGPGASLLITGWTYSPDFPATPGSMQPAFGGLGDAFVVRINTATWTVDYGTFLGGTDWDSGSGIGVDANGVMYVTGSTTSTDFPVTAGALQTTAPGGLGDGFVTKLSTDFSTAIYSTYIGGADQDFADAIAVTPNGVVTVAGFTSSDDFPVFAALQPTRASSGFSGDAFVAKLSADGTAFVYSTYLGASDSGSSAHAVAVGPGGDSYVVGSTSSSRFPTTAGAFLPGVDRSNASTVFVARISDATPPCSYFARPAEVVIPAGGIAVAREAITVVAPNGCPWTAVSNDPWITLTSGGGTGIGHVPYMIPPNAGGTRTGTLSVAGTSVTITQIGSNCSYLVSGVPTQPSGGGSTIATLTAPGGCPWVVKASSHWVTANPASGVGSGSITLTTQPNPSESPRTALFSVGPSFDGVFNVSVSQHGNCNFALTPASSGAVPSFGGTGLFSLSVSPQNCAWSAVSNVAWLSTSPSGGVGSAVVSYSVAANLGGVRAGTLTFGNQSFGVDQNGAPSGSTPWMLPPSPAGGSNVQQTFTFSFFDNDGAANLDVVNVLINNFLDGRFGCYLAYVRSINVLYLVNDPGTALLPGLVLDGSSISIGNSQCLIDGSGSSAQVNGNLLTLTLKMSFESGFAGHKVVYQAGRDVNGNNSGWVQQGVWHVPGGQPGSPAVLAMTPSRGGGGSYPFQFTFSDADGYTDLVSTTVLLNSYLDGGGACYLGYHVPSNTLFLLNDAGNGYQPALVLGATGSVENSQCRILSAGSGSVGTGTTLTLTLRMEFKAGFSGNRVFYLSAQDATTTSGWQSMGSWTVP